MGDLSNAYISSHSQNVSDLLSAHLCDFQILADQEAQLKPKIKELEANVLAAAPDKAKQKQLEKSLEAFKKGRILP